MSIRVRTLVERVMGVYEAIEVMVRHGGDVGMYVKSVLAEVIDEYVRVSGSNAPINEYLSMLRSVDAVHNYVEASGAGRFVPRGTRYLAERLVSAYEAGGVLSMFNECVGYLGQSDVLARVPDGERALYELVDIHRTCFKIIIDPLLDALYMRGGHAPVPK